MSKIIDITNKLNFEENPKFKIKEVEFETACDAITFYKVSALLSEKLGPKEILEIYDLLFDDENKKKFESIKLGVKAFTNAIIEIATNILNNGEDEQGETQTPATT